MTRNTFKDGETRSAVMLNSMMNAQELEGILTGGALSAGTNAFDVDYGAADYLLNDQKISIGAGTVTHQTSDSSLRVDLITFDSAGAANVTKGAPASTNADGDEVPVAPDIPVDEVLAGIVLVRGGSAEILAGDIHEEYRTILQPVAPVHIEPQGSGSGLDADTVDGQEADQLGTDYMTSLDELMSIAGR